MKPGHDFASDEPTLGIGSLVSASAPTQMTGITGAIVAVAGYEHTMLLKSDTTRARDPVEHRRAAWGTAA